MRAVSATIDTAAIASAFAAPAFTSTSEARLEKATAAGTAPSVAGVNIDASVSAGLSPGRPSQAALESGATDLLRGWLELNC